MEPLAPEITMIGAASLEQLARRAEHLEGVRRDDLRVGDWVVVHTRNSSYWILSLGGGRYRVSGGWFDRHGASPAMVAINGCTWGGSAILTDLIAGPGLFLEFGNRVLTTRIRQVRLIRAVESPLLN